MRGERTGHSDPLPHRISTSPRSCRCRPGFALWRSASSPSPGPATPPGSWRSRKTRRNPTRTSAGYTIAVHRRPNRASPAGRVDLVDHRLPSSLRRGTRAIGAGSGNLVRVRAAVAEGPRGPAPLIPGPSGRPLGVRLLCGLGCGQDHRRPLRGRTQRGPERRRRDPAAGSLSCGAPRFGGTPPRRLWHLIPSALRALTARIGALGWRSCSVPSAEDAAEHLLMNRLPQYPRNATPRNAPSRQSHRTVL